MILTSLRRATKCLDTERKSKFPFQNKSGNWNARQNRPDGNLCNPKIDFANLQSSTFAKHVRTLTICLNSKRLLLSELTFIAMLQWVDLPYQAVSYPAGAVRFLFFILS